MPVAAVPCYLRKGDPEFYLMAPPGHRFLLYFAAWGDNQEKNEIDWRMKDRVPKMKRRQGQLVQEGWDDVPNDQYGCAIAACKTPRFDDERPRRTKPRADPGLKRWQPLMEGLRKRQSALVATFPDEATLCLDALATAPFTTGLGNEHPLENGFAFLNPYGLPYLPGSGVKGVLRQAARELASGEWGDPRRWSDDRRHPLRVDGKPVLDSNEQPVMLSMLDLLFGRETPAGESDHLRGALCFWDVIPQIDGDSLMVEIMTPHQSHYYQQKPAAGSANPHDSGSPNPISFLTVPPGSRFVFHVQCDLALLSVHAPDLAKDGSWKKLLSAAVEHAFRWLGFGAKTAVGYGAMAPVSAEQIAAGEASAERARLRCEWVDATVRDLAAKNNAKEEDTLRGKALAETWAVLTDPQLKARALADIRARWDVKGWWDSPPGGAAKKAKAIYGADADSGTCPAEGC